MMTESAPVPVAPGEKPEDFIDQMKIFGLGSNGSLSQVRPFRISTMQETTIMRAVFMKVSGLDSEQFAENPWGFPFVPYPTPNRSSSQSRTLMVPANISFDFAGHPIFWIDTRLTRPNRAESIDPARWSVRMFYLMLAFGLIDPETLQWISGPRAKGISMSPSDLHNHINDFDSPLGNIMFTAQDLAIPYEEVVAQANVALAKLEALQEQQWVVYREEQRQAYSEASNIVSGEDDTWLEISDNIREITEAVVTAKTKERREGTEFVTPAYTEAVRLLQLINHYERLCVILASPVLRSQARSSSSYTSVATAMQMYNQSVVNGGYEEMINKSVEELFSASAVDLDQFVVFNDTAHNLYLDVFRRLDLSVENFRLIGNGEQPYRDYAEMQMGRGFERQGGDVMSRDGDDMMASGFDDDELERLLRGE